MKKKLLLFLFLALVCVCTLGQTLPLRDFRNPVAGYVVTMTGDTLRGTVDYRSDRENGLSCRFLAQGERGGREYSPKDIAAYGTDADSVSYVSRTLPVDGKEQTVFAETLVEGSIALYRHRATSHEQFFLTDATGKVATVAGGGFSGYTATDALQLKREAYREATALLVDSPAAVELLWKSEATAAGLSAAVCRYNADTSHGDTEAATVRRRPASTFHPRLLVESGVGSAGTVLCEHFFQIKFWC